MSMLVSNMDLGDLDLGLRSILIVELRANSSPHSVPGQARTQTQVLGPKTQFKLGLE